MDRAALEDHVPEVQPHSKHDAAILGEFVIAQRNPFLCLDGALHSVDGAREFHQQAVARRAHHSALELGDLGIDDLRAQRLETRERPRFICPHQARIAGDIRRQDRRKPSLLPHHAWSSPEHAILPGRCPGWLRQIGE